MNKDKELEEAINILNNKIYSLNENIKIYDKGYDLSIKNELTKEKEAIETVLQALDELQRKEKSRIIGNIYEIKIEDLEPILKPYYIPKKKIENQIEILKAQCGGNVFHIQQTLNAEIRLLQELLECK